MTITKSSLDTLSQILFKNFREVKNQWRGRRKKNSNTEIYFWKTLDFQLSYFKLYETSNILPREGVPVYYKTLQHFTKLLTYLII